jgi:putative ABC transport system permease protein
MKTYQIVRQSRKAIFRNKGRSFLTILGIVIGIGSVIALISLGTGVQESVSSRISTLGTTTLTISPGQSFNSNPGSSGQRPGSGSDGFSQISSTLTVEDLESLQDQQRNPSVQAASGTVSGSSVFTIDGVDTRQSILGVGEDQFTIRNLIIAQGKLFTANDIDTKSKVVVMGSESAKDLVGADPIGKPLTINQQQYTVIGVLQPADESGVGNPNKSVYIPYSAAMETFGTSTFSTMIAQATSEDTVDKAKSEITATLLDNHDIKDPKLADFTVFTAKDLLSTISSITGILTSLLAGIAAISLVVGGIGIMNIMLVSVTERTREIGLRKAVGAKTSDILWQFMLEAVMLTISGGILGIGLGWLVGQGAKNVLDITPIITANSILLAVGVSTIVGLVFGIYPAARAARLNPIDALRYE